MSQAAPQRKPAAAERRSDPPAGRSFLPTRSPLLLRKCAQGSAGGECDDCRKKKKLQRHASGPHAVSHVPTIVHDVLAGSGHPLDHGTRSDMETRFAHDFSNVRIHDHARAAESARAVNAEAYTVGQDIVFDSGRYAPSTPQGRSLLAHELAHTVQQRGVQRSTGGVEIPASVEDRRLEREADAMAAQAMSGGALRPASVALLPVTPARALLSRQEKKGGKKKEVEVDSATTKHRVTALGEYTGIGQEKGERNQAFEVDVFELPAAKGPFAKKLCDQLASGGALQAVLDVTASATKTALWQERADTGNLRDRWLDRLRWPAKEADRLWQLAGGDAGFPAVGGKTCQMDHIVELQIGGNNTNENIQPLDAQQNQSSGGEIKQEVFQLAQNILDKPELSTRRPDEVTLRFKTVKLAGVPEVIPDKPKAAPTAPTCLSVARWAEYMPMPKDVKKVETGTEPYPIEAGGAETTLQTPLGWSKKAQAKAVPLRADPVNKAAAELIPGFLLETLHRDGEKVDKIGARLDDQNRKTRLPITVTDKRTEPITFSVDRTTRALKLASGKEAGIAFTYPYLSPGKITKLDNDPATGLVFEGYIQSTVPLLGRLDVSYKAGELVVSKGLDPTKLKPPIPGAKITKAELALKLAPEFKPEGTIAFELGKGEKKLLEGSLTATADERGFALDGKLKAHLPGVDEATGEVHYSGGVWSGGAKLETSQLKNKFKYVKGGMVVIGFGEKGIETSGRVDLDLPNAENVQLALEQKQSKWIFTGSGTFKPPRLGETTVKITYDGDKLIGDAKPGPEVTLFGFTGAIEHLHYEDGKFSGTGSIKFKKGRAQGDVAIKLTPAGKFTGKGTLTYAISENLIATGGAELDANEKLRLSGGLKFTKPIELFKQFAAKQTLVDLGMSIPIPGLSLGPIGGLKVRIDGSLAAAAGIGPGALHDTAVSADFNPLEDKSDADITAASTLRIPAFAEVTGAVSAGIMLDVVIGDATAGLKVSATARLEGGFETKLTLHFRGGRFTADADFDVSLALILIFALEAFIRARAGFGPISAKTEKTWKLAGLRLDSGLKTGFNFPVHYASDEPFKLPSAADIKFRKPELDFGKLLDRAFAQARTEETKN